MVASCLSPLQASQLQAALAYLSNTSNTLSQPSLGIISIGAQGVQLAGWVNAMLGMCVTNTLNVYLHINPVSSVLLRCH